LDATVAGASAVLGLIWAGYSSFLEPEDPMGVTASVVVRRWTTPWAWLADYMPGWWTHLFEGCVHSRFVIQPDLAWYIKHNPDFGMELVALTYVGRPGVVRMFSGGMELESVINPDDLGTGFMKFQYVQANRQLMVYATHRGPKELVVTWISWWDRSRPTE
jgi:hypothetical protein